MGILDRVDELGKPAWIALAVLGFAAWWPLGLAAILFAVGSGRMGRHRGFGRWRNAEAGPANRPMNAWRCGGSRSAGGSSGNRAFDDYRADTLRRLEDEQSEFREFLDRLRLARDRAEFDQFMAERRREQSQPPSPQPEN